MTQWLSGWTVQRRIMVSFAMAVVLVMLVVLVINTGAARGMEESEALSDAAVEGIQTASAISVEVFRGERLLGGLFFVTSEEEAQAVMQEHVASVERLQSLLDEADPAWVCAPGFALLTALLWPLLPLCS